MPETDLMPSIEKFYGLASKGQLQLAECSDCKAKYATPKTVCPKCLSTKMRFIPSTGSGKIVSYTVIHVPPIGFQEKAPYILGIVELQEGPRLLGLINGVKPEEAKVGQRVKFAAEPAKTAEWPTWARLSFTPE